MYTPEDQHYRTFGAPGSPKKSPSLLCFLHFIYYDRDSAMEGHDIEKRDSHLDKGSDQHLETREGQHHDPEEDQEYQNTGTGPLKLDPKGLPLIPQPSDSPNDPLNWSRRRKYAIVLLSAITAFFGSFQLAVATELLSPI